MSSSNPQPQPVTAQLSSSSSLSSAVPAVNPRQKKEEKEKFITCDHCRKNKSRCIKQSQIAACNACKKHGLQCTVGIKRQRKRKNGPQIVDQQFTDVLPDNNIELQHPPLRPIVRPSPTNVRLGHKTIVAALSSHLIQESFKILTPVSEDVIPNFFQAFENAGRDASQLGPYGEILAAAHIGSGSHNSFHSALVGKISTTRSPTYGNLDLRPFGYARQGACSSLKRRAADLLEASDALRRPSLETMAVILDVVRLFWMTRFDIADRYFKHALAHWRYLESQPDRPTDPKWAQWIYLFDSTLSDRMGRGPYITEQEICTVIAPMIELPADSFIDPSSLLALDPEGEIENENTRIFVSGLALHRIFGFAIQQIEALDDQDIVLSILQNLISRVDQHWRWLEARRLHDLRVAPNGPSKSFTYYQFYSRRGEFAIRVFRCLSIAEKRLKKRYHQGLDTFRQQLQARVDIEISNFAEWLNICHCEMMMDVPPDITSSFVRPLRLICRVFEYLPDGFKYWQRYLRNGPKPLSKKLHEAGWVLQVCRPLGFFSSQTADWSTQLEESLKAFSLEQQETPRFTELTTNGDLTPILQISGRGQEHQLPQAKLYRPPLDTNISLPGNVSNYSASLAPSSPLSPPTSHYSPTSPRRSPFTADMPYSPPPSMVDSASPVPPYHVPDSDPTPSPQTLESPTELFHSYTSSSSAASWDVDASISPSISSSLSSLYPSRYASSPAAASWDRNSSDRVSTHNYSSLEQPVVLMPENVNNYNYRPAFPFQTQTQTQESISGIESHATVPRQQSISRETLGPPVTLLSTPRQSESIPIISHSRSTTFQTLPTQYTISTQTQQTSPFYHQHQPPTFLPQPISSTLHTVCDLPATSNNTPSISHEYQSATPTYSMDRGHIQKITQTTPISHPEHILVVPAFSYPYQAQPQQSVPMYANSFSVPYLPQQPSQPSQQDILASIFISDALRDISNDPPAN